MWAVLLSLAASAALAVDGASLRHQLARHRLSFEQLHKLETELINAVKAHPTAGIGATVELNNTALALRKFDAELSSAISSGSSASGKLGSLGVDQIADLLAVLKEGIMTSHNSTKDRVNNLISAFAQCNVDKDMNVAGLASSNATVHAKHVAHVACRLQESDEAKDKDACDVQMQQLGDTKDAVCAARDALKKDPGTAADVCHSQGEEWGDWLIRNRDYFIEQAEKYQKAEEACTNATQKMAAIGPGCTTANTEWADKKSECDTLQEDLESATCSYGVKSNTVCDSLGTCWDGAKSAYDSATPSIIAQVAADKAQWRAVKRMECLVETFDSGDQDSSIDDCISKVHDTSHLDVQIPPAPDQPGCTANVPTPCSAAYKSDRYSSLPADAQATTCSPCSITGSSDSKWVPVMKLMTDAYKFENPLWENDQLDNEASPVPAEEDAKYPRYLDTPFRNIRVCVGSPEGNCVEHHFDSEWANARALFSAGYIRDETLDYQGFLSVFGVPDGGIKHCPMQRPGFNLQCLQGNYARWGFCNNIKTQPCQGDAGDSDASIGVGLDGDGDVGMGAGFTRDFLGPYKERKRAKAWLWIERSGPSQVSANPQSVNDDSWSLVMKIKADKELGYSNPLWEDDNLLNPQSDIADTTENAKYQDFLDTPFKSIRMCIGSPTGNCVAFTFDTEWASAKALFSAGYTKQTGLDKQGILNAFGPTPGSYQDCPMQRPGFNIQCNDGNWARFGFCNNCPSQPCQNEDENDADSAIGLGLRGQSTGTEMGAGWTNYFASGAGTCSANSMTFKTAWLWVKK